jgi:uncharacterized membrane protein YkoI
MRRLPFLGLMATLASGVAQAQTSCLTDAEAREVVAGSRVVSPDVAIRNARRANPGYEILRALLCRQKSGYVYVVTMIGRDGRVIRRQVNAGSGRGEPAY